MKNIKKLLPVFLACATITLGIYSCADEFLEEVDNYMVPLFINEGDKIKIETQKGTYKERIK